MRLPCLSVLQPWAKLICDGRKDVENRVWNTRYRGTFLIHTGKRMSHAYWEGAVCAVDAEGVTPGMIGPRAGLPLGGIVGAAELLEVLPPGSADRPWYDGDFGFVLGRRIALPFRALSGKRRFFEVEATKAEAAALRKAGLLPRVAA